MNTKANVDFTLWGLMALFGLVFIIGAAMWGFNSYLNSFSHPTEEMVILSISSRFTNNADCFAYQDPATQRVEIGTIDLDKFNKEQMNRCYQTRPEQNHRGYNFELKLENNDISVLTSNFYQNRNDFTDVRSVRVYSDGKYIQEDTLFINAQEAIGGEIS